MKIIKRLSTQKNKKGYNYTNYFLELDNGNRIAIKCAFVKDIQKLDVISVYEKNKNITKE